VEARPAVTTPLLPPPFVAAPDDSEAFEGDAAGAAVAALVPLAAWLTKQQRATPTKAGKSKLPPKAVVVPVPPPGPGLPKLKTNPAGAAVAGDGSGPGPTPLAAAACPDGLHPALVRAIMYQVCSSSLLVSHDHNGSAPAAAARPRLLPLSLHYAPVCSVCFHYNLNML
jgi:hypothetical protein